MFVYPGQPENATKTEVPIVELLEELPEEWVCLNTFRDLPYDALTLLENVLDASHVPYQERYLEEAGGSTNFAKAFYLPTKADRFVSQLRQWVNQYSAEPFPTATLPPALPREKLLERYHSHTLKCASCRAALANIQRLRIGLAIAAVLVWAIALLLALSLGETPVLARFLSATVILVFAATWLGLGRLEMQFFTGRDVPPRNLPEKR